ncbi:MAG: zinc ribbon domain-containing protein [Candidatus Bruticola sp.]
MSECPKCHTQVLPNSRYCDMCGYELAKDTISDPQSFSHIVQNDTDEAKSDLKADTAAVACNGADEQSSHSESETQFNLAANGSKAALPSSPSKILQTTKLRSQNVRAKSTIPAEGFLTSLADKIRTTAAEVNLSAKTFISNINKASSTKTGGEFTSSAPGEDNQAKVIANKIIAALLGIGMLILCIFIIAKKLTLATLSPFIPNNYAEK